MLAHRERQVLPHLLCQEAITFKGTPLKCFHSGLDTEKKTMNVFKLEPIMPSEDEFLFKLATDCYVLGFFFFLFEILTT